MSEDRPGEVATATATSTPNGSNTAGGDGPVWKPRALLSVSDKTGIVAFAKALQALGWELISTGGTARHLAEAGLPVLQVEEVTGHPEMMDGRVKTLHPAVSAGVLARLDRADDRAALASLGYQPIELVAVNLYPFVATAATRPDDATLIEQIDIGGPTLLRAAAKNHAHVLSVCEPSAYDAVLAALQQANGDPKDVPLELRQALALTTFEHTAAYDSAIASTLHVRWKGSPETAVPDDTAALPSKVLLSAHRKAVLRYGENPHQAAALYEEDGVELLDAPALVEARQLAGVDLSYNNWLDLDSALKLARAFQPQAWPRAPYACVVVKHNNPCGVALAPSQAHAWRDALASDPQSAFGCVVAFNSTVDEVTAEAIGDHFIECIIAPGYTPAALERLAGKSRRRLLALAPEGEDQDAWLAGRESWMQVRGIEGGWLMQTDPLPPVDWDGLEVVTEAPVDAALHDSMRFGALVCQRVASNAIVFVQGTRTVGIGPGQTSRVEAVTIAAHRAGDRAKGAVMVSDAFFPFADGLDEAAKVGIAAVLQPGGSIRDDEVIEAADRYGMAMAFSRVRLFRH